jgi:hypothetical protein
MLEAGKDRIRVAPLRICLQCSASRRPNLFTIAIPALFHICQELRFRIPTIIDSKAFHNSLTAMAATAKALQ